MKSVLITSVLLCMPVPAAGRTMKGVLVTSVLICMLAPSAERAMKDASITNFVQSLSVFPN